jgi:hypothetical protein
MLIYVTMGRLRVGGSRTRRRTSWPIQFSHPPTDSDNKYKYFTDKITESIDQDWFTYLHRFECTIKTTDTEVLDPTQI